MAVTIETMVDNTSIISKRNGTICVKKSIDKDCPILYNDSMWRVKYLSQSPGNSICVR